MDLSGKHVVYLGGFGGIGQKCLWAFLNKNIKNLAILDLHENTALLKELQKSFEGANIFYVKLDITDKLNITTAYKEVAARMGHFDVIVNGCGLMDDRYVDLTIQINLLGLIHSTITGITYMDKAKGSRGGLIVNISSVAGLEPSPMMAVYGASKFGVTAFTRSLSHPLYFENTGIGFITICPGVTSTNLVADPSNKGTLEYSIGISDIFDKLKRQSAEQCATNLVKAVELAKNGSVWLLDVGELKEVHFPKIWNPPFL